MCIVQILDDFCSFIDHIEKDAKINDFNPVRFINVDTMSTWVKAKTFLGNKAIDILKLSDFCTTDDIAPNLNQFKKALRHKSVSTLVLPLSEYLRINNPIAKKVLNDILHAKFEFFNVGKNRIYILLYRMKDLLMDLDLTPKESKTVLAIRETVESDYALTIMQNDLEFYKCGNDIDGFKKYFVYWEQNPDKPIVLHTKNAITYSDIIFSDNVEVIVSAFGLLRSYGLSQLLTEDMGNTAQWAMLHDASAGLRNVELSLSQHFGSLKYSDDLFRNWAKFTEDDQWLLWVWAHLCTKNIYLQKIFNEKGQFHDFISDIKRKIVDFISDSKFTHIYEDRKKLIASIGINITEEDIDKLFGSIVPNEILRLLTNCSKDERVAILRCISEINKSEIYMPIIKEIYPILYQYLQPIVFDNDVFSEYFRLYRFSKVQDQADEKLLMMVKENARSKCSYIYELPSRNIVVNNEYTDGSVVYFVDALGAEYVCALVSCLDSLKYNISIQFTHCNLPSITELNNDFYKDKNYIEPYYDLDTWKHSHCTYPYSIEHELVLIQKIALNVMEKLQDNKIKKIIIASDHGSSRFAVKNRGRSYGLSKTAIPYKFGRYCQDAVTSYSEIDGCIPQDDFWVFANYDRFVQKGAPVNEIHGGASIEEMVVPVITITPHSGHHKVGFDIQLVTDIFKLSTNRTISVQFMLNPVVRNVEVSVDGKKYSCIYQGEFFIYEQKITDRREKYVAKIINNGKIIGEISYEVEWPVKKNDRFDI